MSTSVSMAIGENPIVNQTDFTPLRISNARIYPKIMEQKPMMAGTAWNFTFRSALFSNLTNPISDVLKRNLLLDSINTITIAKIKQAVFTMALILKKGISELLIDKSSNLVMPKTMPL